MSIPFTQEQIHAYALPGIIAEGDELYRAGAVRDVQILNGNIFAKVNCGPVYRVVIQPQKKLVSECTCGFSLGGACCHVVAVMAAVNDRDAVQTGLVLHTDPGAPQIQPHAAPGQCDNDTLLPSAEKTELYPERLPASIAVETVAAKPVGRIYLYENDSVLFIELRFAYLVKEPDKWIEFTRSDTVSEKLFPHKTNTVLRIVRSRARENEIAMRMDAYSVKNYQRGIFTPLMDSREWITAVLPLMAQDGFEIFGHKSLVNSTVRQGRPRIFLKIKSRDTAMRCSLSVDVNGIPASLASLIKAVRERSAYIKLTDESSGVIPESWITLLGRIFTAAHIDYSDDTFTVQHSHLPLLNMLYDMADSICADDAYVEKRKLLQDFNGIEKQPLPEQFNGVMRSYQVAGYEWFYFLRKFGFGGCLADDMGLGKTVQTLALLLREKQVRGKKMPSLVIAPTSVLFNWELEARHFAPTLLVARYYGPTRRRMLIALDEADLVVTTYGTVLRDIDTLKEIAFNYVILDEAQAIKNPTSQIVKTVRQLTCGCRLALSGTPVENDLSELWSLFSFLNPGMFGTLSHFKSDIVRPIVQDNDPIALDILKRMIFPFVLRRTKQQVAGELPPKTETVIYTEMLPKQLHVYNITREAYLGRIMDSVNRVGIERSGIQIIDGMLRLRQICCHPLLVDENYQGDSAKFTALDEYIYDITVGGHRVLIFSQFEALLRLLSKRLREKKLKHAMLTGQTRNRGEVVAQFKDSDIPLFLISLKAGGTGLNLTEADYVIHLDPWWNPAAENQATDRAYRIGQTRSVFVYKFIVKNSIEERVLDMQRMKKMISSSIITSEEAFFKRLTKQDILALFTEVEY